MRQDYFVYVDGELYSGPNDKAYAERQARMIKTVRGGTIYRGRFKS